MIGTLLIHLFVTSGKYLNLELSATFQKGSYSVFDVTFISAHPHLCSTLALLGPRAPDTPKFQPVLAGLGCHFVTLSPPSPF